ncbi:MAG: maleylpyruvate isomerase N-terminal domain-containing protein [Actinomycetota bacterium]
MDRKQELVEAEEASWDEFHGLLNRLTPEQMDEPTLNPDGWSVKDLIWHMGCWAAEGASALERIRMGTYAEEDWDTDAKNATFLEEGRRMDLDTVRSEWSAARNRCLQEWNALVEITPDAEEWFYEEGPEHAADHLPELRRFVEGVG